MEHKIIPTLADKWARIRAQLQTDGYSGMSIEMVEAGFYRGIHTYIALQKEMHMSLSSPEMDRALHNWEMEAYDRDGF
jgi:hypothetical protein